MQAQDRACPLYRLASRPMLPAPLYPASTEEPARISESSLDYAFSLN